MDTLNAVLLLAAFVPAVLFPIVYLTRSGWPTTLPGWSSLSFGVVVALTLGLSTARAIWGDYPYRDAVRIVVSVLIVIVLWVQLIVLLIVQHRHRVDESDRSPTTQSGGLS